MTLIILVRSMIIHLPDKRNVMGLVGKTDTHVQIHSLLLCTYTDSVI